MRQMTVIQPGGSRFRSDENRAIFFVYFVFVPPLPPPHPTRSTLLLLLLLLLLKISDRAVASF